MSLGSHGLVHTFRGVRPVCQQKDPKTPVMTLNDLSTPGNIIFLDPRKLEEHGYLQQIRGVHPYLVIDAVSPCGQTVSHVIPLTSKGSRAGAVSVPAEFRRGTDKFMSRPCYLYSVSYAQYIPTWVLLEAVSPGANAQHNGNHLTPAGVLFVRERVR